MVQFVIDHKAVILGFLFATSELLSLSPAVKSNGVFQFIVNLIKPSAPKQA